MKHRSHVTQRTGLTALTKMTLVKYGYVAMVTCILLTNISALQNGLDRGFTYCTRGQMGTTIKVEKGDRGSIASVGYPGNYSVDVYHGRLCNVEIQACRTCKLHLKFVLLEFPVCVRPKPLIVTNIRSVCVPGCDHLRIFEVDQPYHSSTERNYFQKDQGSAYESISSRVVILHCMSNASLAAGKRFLIKYEVTDKIRKIQGTVTSPLQFYVTGQIISPNFPHGYALNGETFTYVIQNLDPYGHIRVVFDDWDIANKSHIQVYDDISGNTKAQILRRGHRPTIVSNTNTIVIVFNVGEDPFICCTNIGFKATYQFVSDRSWLDKPRTDCGESYLLKTGGTITFRGETTPYPQSFDCVWTVKRQISNDPDGVVLQIDEVSLGKGWLQTGINSLEVYAGLTSVDDIIARYTSSNMTPGQSVYTTGGGFYVRLRGIFGSNDVIKLVYTGVNNITSDGCPGLLDFLCDNLWCVHQELTCDGVNHCGDSSDEEPAIVCPDNNLDLLAWSNHVNELTTKDPCHGGIRCRDNRQCIQRENVCDRKSHCQDGSDELNCNYRLLGGSASSSGGHYLLKLSCALLTAYHLVT